MIWMVNFFLEFSSHNFFLKKSEILSRIITGRRKYHNKDIKQKDKY